VLPDPVARLDPGFTILVAIDGVGQLQSAAGDGMPLRRGQTVLLPHAVGATTVSGAVHAVRCRPPAEPPSIPAPAATGPATRGA
jgi:mannose-6-phosphate isomerase